MPVKVSERGAVAPFIAMDVMRQANERDAAGESVIHLEAGQPGSGAPRRVVEAAARALATDRLGYTDALGILPLRQRIARHYREAYGIDIDPDCIAVTTGSSSAFILAFLAAFEVGDRVGMSSPGYPAYRNMLTALGLETVLLRTHARDRFQPTVELIESLDRPLDGLIVASPSNPTGTMLDRRALQALIDACALRGIRLISDEVYHGITYDRQADSAVGGEVIVTNGFSKYYAMTGWRLGWAVFPRPLLRSVECLIQNLFISAPTLSQIAAVEAFDCKDELDGLVRSYARNRALLLERLPAFGFGPFAPPDGAFYLYTEVSRLSDDSVELCDRMLAEAGVAATPGIDFDPERGHRFVRFSFAGPESDVADAVDRLQAWLGM